MLRSNKNRSMSPPFVMAKQHSSRSMSPPDEKQRSKQIPKTRGQSLQRKAEVGKPVGSTKLGDDIRELVQQQVDLAVTDLRVRLDRLEALLFCADKDSFAAIDKVISAATKLHAGGQRFTEMSQRKISETPSPGSSLREVDTGVGSMKNSSEREQGEFCASILYEKPLSARSDTKTSSLGTPAICSTSTQEIDPLAKFPLERSAAQAEPSCADVASQLAAREDSASLKSMLPQVPATHLPVVSDDVRVGDLVRVERAIHSVMDADSAPVSLAEGLIGRILQIDSDGDWLVKFPGREDPSSMNWILSSNQSQVRVFRAALPGV